MELQIIIAFKPVDEQIICVVTGKGMFKMIGYAQVWRKSVDGTWRKQKVTIGPCRFVFGLELVPNTNKFIVVYYKYSENYDDSNRVIIKEFQYTFNDDLVNIELVKESFAESTQWGTGLT